MRKNALAWMILAAGLALAGAPKSDADGAGTPADAQGLWTFDPILRLIGADLGVGYRGLPLIPGDQTTLWVYGGGGYEGEHTYRDQNGALLSPGQIGSAAGPLANADPTFNRLEAAWRLGIEQGFAWNPRTSTSLLEAFFFYRGRYDVNQYAAGGLMSMVAAPDRDSSLLNTFQLGFGYDDLLTSRHRTRDGTSAELTAEWGPPWLFNTIQGQSDFLRFNGTFTWFFPCTTRLRNSP